jgi:hypothetical protein
MIEPIEQRDDHTELLAIEGEQLSAVTFVQDYIQLHFDGPVVTAITLPIVIIDDTSFGVGAPGYRDRLCGQIAKKVVRAYVRPADRLQIEFLDGSTLVISLRPKDYRAAEAVIFSDGMTKKWASW